VAAIGQTERRDPSESISTGLLFFCEGTMQRFNAVGLLPSGSMVVLLLYVLAAVVPTDAEYVVTRPPFAQIHATRSACRAIGGIGNAQ
jgi:hypothetical protein